MHKGIHRSDSHNYWLTNRELVIHTIIGLSRLLLGKKEKKIGTEFIHHLDCSGYMHISWTKDRTDELEGLFNDA